MVENEGRTFVTTNNQGYRDKNWHLEPNFLTPPHISPKEPVTFKIAVLGDSYSEATHVSMEKTYWFILQKLLNQRYQNKSFKNHHGIKIEVMNFGVRGYGTTQEYLTFKHEVLKFKPQLVLLEFYTENDIIENSPYLNPKI